MTPLAYTRRALKLQRQCKPCPRCGGKPQVDLGLLDGLFETGREYIHCPTYFMSYQGISEDQGCGMCATGLAAWNLQPEADRLRARIAELEDQLNCRNEKEE